MLNLLVNAVKFTIQGHITIKVEYIENLNKVKFRIIDSGIGVPLKN